MISATDLQLPHLPIEDPAFAREPLRYIELARSQHPWLATSNLGYVVHEYQAIRDLTLMDAKFNPSLDAIIELMDARGTRWGDFMNNLMLAKDPPEHTRLRSSVASSFTPRIANNLRPLMRSIVSGLLDEWTPKGRFDFADFAANFPIRVMFGLIGAPTDALPGIRRSLEIQGLSASADKTLLPALEEAYTVLWNFVDGLVTARERDGGGGAEDVLTRLMASHSAGDLSAEELRTMLIFLFAAGYDTSKNMLTFIMHVMLEHPDEWVRCAHDRPYCDAVVEEIFRYHSVSNIYRTSKEAIEYRDVVIPTGSILILTLTLAGRDPHAFEDANRFQPGRTDPNRHAAFGRGIHMCLGQHLARAQIQEGVHLIAQRLHNPHLAGEVMWRPFPGVWGIRSLPIEFSQAAGGSPGGD